MAQAYYDAMFQSQHPRSQLLRQLSTHSGSTSGSSRIGPTRVMKQTSANSSPHKVQRRRTTASHTTRRSPYQTQEQRLRNYYSSRHQAPPLRPMSWHPGSDSLHTSATSAPAYEQVMGNTIEGLENLAMSGTPTSAVHQSVEHALTMGYGYPPTTNFGVYDQSSLAVPGYGMFETAFAPTHIPYASYEVPQQKQYEHISQPLAYDIYAPMSADMQQWPHTQSYHPPQAADKSTTVLPTQVRPSEPQEENVRPRPQMARRGSKELISIGLYDDDEDDNDFMSTLSLAIGSKSQSGVEGKGLKLEETWQPPNDDEDKDDDEGYSSEEGDEVDDPPVQTVMPAEVQSFCSPTYGDLSNQSFFFSDDDQYASEGHYTDYYAMNQGYQYTEPKPVDPATGNLLWF